MLLNLEQLFHKYNMAVKGVLQVGAHFGQEYDSYKKLGLEKIIFVEPGDDAYAELVRRFGTIPGITLFHTACGDGAEGISAQAYTEKVNKGMSSSLLPPKVHLTQHADVIFDGIAIWPVTMLDSLSFNRHEYNLLNMDVQGYEMRVLNGATETLEHIDYIYSEVNRQEMYANCAMIDDMIKYLKDFQLVEVGWASDVHGWGDGFWIRKTLL